MANKNYFAGLALLVLISYSNHILGQSYVDEAKQLIAFRELYEALDKKDKELFGKDTTSIEAYKKFLLDILAAQDVGNISNQNTYPDFEVHGENEVTRTVTPKENIFPLQNAVFKKISEELKWFVILTESDSSIFEIDECGLKEEYKDLPQTFKYLSAAIRVLENSETFAKPTSGSPLGSLIGVSETQILQGITDWALTRAQEELMQSFLREWLEKIQSDPLLAQAFPNTLTMLATSDLTSIYTDGDTWKATFQQDFNAIPEKTPILARLVLDQSKKNIPSDTKDELVAGFEVLSHVFGALNKNKRPVEILLVQGEKSFLENQSKDYKPIVHRSIVGLHVFMKALRSESTEGKIGYVTPDALLELNGKELRMLWKLIYLRNVEKLKFTFGLETDIEEKAFFDSVVSGIQKFKLQLTSVSETITAFSEILKEIEKSEDNKLSIENFHTYSLLTFDLVSNGADIMESLTDIDVNLNEIKKYKTLYTEGYEYFSLLHAGIKTKEYGKVVVNLVNLVVWMRTFLGKTTTSNLNLTQFIGTEKLQDLVTDDLGKKAITSVLEKIEKSLGDKLKAYPQTATFVSRKIESLRAKLTSSCWVLTQSRVKKAIADALRFSEIQTQIVIKEIASNRIYNLQSSSEALNKYAKLMASIILAEDSDDIKEALNLVATKQGGYLVRQKSVFSAIVTFYPGIEYGWERLEGNNVVPDIEGTYLGATLPIGIELAAGTNTKGIGALGLFLQVLDLGAVLNYRLSNDMEEVSSNPEFGFQQVFSPGAYTTFHLTNNPITLGFGASYAPKLREVSSNGSTLNANSLQYGFFLGVDLNVFTLYGSKKKFSSDSESLKRAYDK